MTNLAEQLKQWLGERREWDSVEMIHRGSRGEPATRCDRASCGKEFAISEFYHTIALSLDGPDEDITLCDGCYLEFMNTDLETGVRN